MAVIVIKRIQIGDSFEDLKTFQPSGALTKQDRERAEQLDKILQTEILDITEEVFMKTKNTRGVMKRFYTLGQKIRKLVDNNDLILKADVDSGIIWDAVWQYLPDTMRPKGSTDNVPYSEKRQRRKDHLTLCYEISEFKWSEVKWIRRWDDWFRIASRPGIVRDKRIFFALRNAISTLEKYPDKHGLTSILKNLREAFPTRQHRDSSQFSDERIIESVNTAVEKAMS